MFLCNISAYIINSLCCCGDERDCVILLRHLSWFNIKTNNINIPVNHACLFCFMVSRTKNFSCSVSLSSSSFAYIWFMQEDFGTWQFASGWLLLSGRMSETRESFVHLISIESLVYYTQVIIIAAYVYTYSTGIVQ